MYELYKMLIRHHQFLVHGGPTRVKKISYEGDVAEGTLFDLYFDPERMRATITFGDRRQHEEVNSSNFLRATDQEGDKLVITCGERATKHQMTIIFFPHDPRCRPEMVALACQD